MTAPVQAAHLTDADRILAAEYVLGTLDSEERRNVRARIAADPHFAGLVRLWERRLSPLHELAVPVTPPPSIWRAIVADLKAVPAAALPKTSPKPPAKPASKAQRKAPSADPMPRPVVGEIRPGRAPAPRAQGPVAAVRRLFGLARPGVGVGEAPARPNRPVPAQLPVAPPVPEALRLPGGRTLGGAIQDAVAAGLLPPAPPLPEPPPAPAPERAAPLPPPLKLVPPPAPLAPPRPRPVPEPLTPPPAFIFLEPDPPSAAESAATEPDQTAHAPPPADEGVLAPGPPSPPTFTLLEPAEPSPGANQPVPLPATDTAAFAPQSAAESAAGGQASVEPSPDGVTPSPSGSPATSGTGVPVDAPVPEAGAEALPQARTEPSGFEPDPAPLPSLPAKTAPIEPTQGEPPSADPAAGAKGEEAPPLPGWAAVVASGVVSALPDPATTADAPASDDALRRPLRRSGFPWRAATLTLAALLIAVAAFVAYREWFWPRDGQWVGVLQSEPLPAVAVRLDPDSGVIFVRSFAPVPPEGEINRLWLRIPGRPALLLGEFTAGVSGRTSALAGLGRNRIAAAEVVVTQEPKLSPGTVSDEGEPSGKVVYRGRLAPE